MRKLCVVLGTLMIGFLSFMGLSYGGPPTAMPSQQRPVVTSLPPIQGPFSGYPALVGPMGPALGPISMDPVGACRPYVKLGSLWMNEKVDFPFRAPDPANPQFNFEQMTLTMNTEQFWVGFVGLETDPMLNVILYGEIGGSVPKDASITMEATGRALLPAPDNEQNLVSPWVWTAHNIHWWMAEAGAAFMVTPTLGFEVGFRTEHIDYKLKDPRNFAPASDVGIAAGLLPGLGISCGRI